MSSSLPLLFVGDDEAAPSYLLDSYPALAAYSTNFQLRTGQTNCRQIREDAGDTLQNFGFASGELDAAAVATFLAGANGFDRTWYDQSGNGNDVVQTTNANQPAYVASGQNSKPVLDFNGSHQLHTTLSAALSVPFTVFAVARLDVAGNNNNVFLTDSDNNRLLFFQRGLSSPNTWALNNGSTWNTGSETGTGVNLFTMLFNGASSQLWIDGVSIGTGNTGSGTPDDYYIGGKISLWDGWIIEWLLFDSDQSANRAAIEADINSRWAIY